MIWTILIAFMAASGLTLLVLSLWWGRYSPQARAKALRLRAITQALGAQDLARRNERLPSVRLDRWLREHVPAYLRLEDLLASSGSEKSPLQILTLCLGLMLGFFLFGVIWRAGFWISAMLAAGAAFTPILILQQKAQRRRAMFEDKLPEALDFLTRALRAGHSFSVALGMAAHELSAPISVEFKKVFDEIGFGIPFGESMTAMARRVQSQDLDFLVIALMIQRETGGNLTELLEGLARTIRERIKLKGKVRTLSAEGRFSAVLLGVMPFALGLILSFLNPAYMAALWQTSQGHNILLSGAVLLIVGFVALNRITRIKV